MTIDSRMHDGFSPSIAGSSILALVSLGLWAWLRGCAERRQQRIALAALNDELLKDLGLSRDDVSRESVKWPWQA